MTRGITVMTYAKISFTKEQQETLASNPFTLSVNDHQIRFTVEFKKYLLEERKKNETPWKEIFRKAGYDPDVLGKNRIDKIIQTVRKEAASPKGLHETTSKKALNKQVKKHHQQKEIEELQKEVVRLQQQIDFLKKIQMLRVLEENDN